jgi:hypothetical protein
MNLIARCRAVLSRQPFTFLLSALIIAILIGPIAAQSSVSLYINRITISVVFFAAMSTLLGYRQMVVTAVVLVTVTAVTTWLTLVYQGWLMVIIDHITTMLFLGFIILTSTRMVDRAKSISGEPVRGAICIYMLLGFLFATTYSLVEYLSPGSILISETHHVDVRDTIYGGDLFHYMIYFSFVTQTTLGYGDVIPHSLEAQAIAMLQACVGPLFLAVAIARLVSLELTSKGRQPAN